MANKTLFQSLRASAALPPADAVNSEGAPAYAMAAEHALAQYAMTGCLNATFYASAEAQLEAMVRLAAGVDASFLGRTAVYARERGWMKDAPALLCAVLSTRDPRLLRLVFDRVMTDTRMVRTFVQVLRSGVTGRRSLGTVPKRLVQSWFSTRTDDQVFRASVGCSPSMADLIRLVHPRPSTPSRAALYAYLLGREPDAEALPVLVREFEAFKRGATAAVPDVPFQMLTALELGREGWSAIARQASWQTTRMNLNTFARHGVFQDPAMIRCVARRLADRDQVRKARVYPYQLLAAHRAATAEVPAAVRQAIEQAMEHSIGRVPAFRGRVHVCPDVSGSMQSPVTGHRKGATSAVRCVDVAALVAAAVLRKNRSASVLPFATEVLGVEIRARDTVFRNAERMAAACGGGTACSAPIAWLNRNKAGGDLVIVISDNESWADAGGQRGTAMMAEWNVFRRSNPGARLVCIDLQPNATVQAVDREDVLNVGGFSDAVFDLVESFAEGRMGSGHWAGAIRSVRL